MSIKINQQSCTGCRQCAMVCPGSLIRIDAAGKAKIAYPEDCWGCLSCVKECNFGAIRFYLGADIGGRGTTLHTEANEAVIRWIFEHQGKDTREILIHRKDSNAY